MDINDLQQINTFAKGMNTDTSDALLDSQEYRLANNLRIITNQDENTGELHLIDGTGNAFDIKNEIQSDPQDIYDIEVLQTASIRDYGVAIVRRYSNKEEWAVVSLKLLESPQKAKIAFGWCDHPIGKKLSLVTKWEDDDNVKVYIADGINPIALVNIAAPFVDENFSANSNYNKITSYPTVVFTQPKFNGFVSGTLKAGMVAYSYQLYNKYGNSSGISPSTKLIPIVSGSGNMVSGLDKDKTSDKGVSITIPQLGTDFDSMRIFRIMYLENGQEPVIEVIYDYKNIASTQDGLFVDGGLVALSTYTLEEYNSISGIHIVPKVIESKDGFLFAANIQKEIDTTVSKEILNWDARAYRFNASGRAKVKTGSTEITVDPNESVHWGVGVDEDCFVDFNDINVPYESFNTSDMYMFQKDPTNAGTRWFGGSGPNVEWRFVIATLIGDSNTSPSQSNNGYSGIIIGTEGNPLTLSDDSYSERLSYVGYYTTGLETRSYPEGGSRVNSELYKTISGLTYANAQASYYFKSLRRGELYRYGIILYDNKGNASPVKWIADVRVPEVNTQGFHSFLSREKIGSSHVDLGVRPIGLEFKVKNLPDNVVAYEIVRCARTESDTKTLSQGVVARPVKKYIGTENKYQADNFPYVPTGWVTNADYWAGGNRVVDYVNINEDWEPLEKHAETNTEMIVRDGNPDKDFLVPANRKVFQFISPEVCYTQDATISLFKQETIKIDPMLYVFGVGNYIINSSSSSPNVLEWDTIFRKDYGVTEKMTDWYNGVRGASDDELFFPGNKNTRILVQKSTVVAFVDVVPGSENWHTMQIAKNIIYGNRTGISGTATEGVNYGTYDRDIITMPVCLQVPLYYSAEDTEGSWRDIIQKYEHDTDHRVMFQSLDKNSYQYIKLYEQTVRPLRIKRDVSISSGYTQDVLQYSINSREHVNTKATQVKAVNVANSLNWDEFSQTKDPYNLIYIDKSVPVGANNFVNWVTNGGYGMSPKDGNKYLYWSAPNWTDQAIWVNNYVMGSGGKCALFELEGINDFLSYTSASESVLSHIYNNGDRIQAEFVTNIHRVDNDTSSTFGGNYNGIITTGGYKIISESRLGTYLCNITHSVNPYGGYTKVIRDTNIYQSYGDYFNVSSDNTAIVFDGDCYIQAFEYVAKHKFAHPLTPYVKTSCCVYSIPVETNINLAYTNGTEFRKEQNSYIQELPADVNGQYTQDRSLYVYNAVYSQNNNFMPHAAELNTDTYDQAFDTRCFYSNPKSSDEYFDNWLVFMPANYIDVDSRNGQITHLRTFNNKLVYWQEKATGLFSVNERVAVSDNSNLPLILGTGGVLDRYDYLYTQNGMREGEFVDAQSDTTLYWWDHDNAELCAYTDSNQRRLSLEVVLLSKVKNIQNFINRNLSNLSNSPKLFYDKKYNELVANISNGSGHDAGSLLFNENLGIFISLVKMNPQFAIQVGGSTFLINHQKSIGDYTINNEAYTVYTTIGQFVCDTGVRFDMVETFCSQNNTCRFIVDNPDAKYVELSERVPISNIGTSDQISGAYISRTPSGESRALLEYSAIQLYINGNDNLFIHIDDFTRTEQSEPTSVEYFKLSVCAGQYFYTYPDILPTDTNIAPSLRNMLRQIPGDSQLYIYYIYDQNNNLISDQNIECSWVISKQEVTTASVQQQISNGAICELDVPLIEQDILLQNSSWDLNKNIISGSIYISKILDSSQNEIQGLDLSNVQCKIQTAITTTDIESTWHGSGLSGIGNNGDMYKWNDKINDNNITLFGTPIYPYLKYVVNRNNTLPKTFDITTFGGRVYGGEKPQLQMLKFTFNTPLKQKGVLESTGNSELCKIENREYDFRFAIPRACQYNTETNIWETKEFGDRLRGKTMQCELESSSSSYDFSLQYIITKYRTSWI